MGCRDAVVRSCRCEVTSDCPLCGEEYPVCDCRGCSGCGRSLEDAIDAHHDRECDHPADCDQCGARVASSRAKTERDRDAASWSAWAAALETVFGDLASQEPGVVTSDGIPNDPEAQPSTAPGTTTEAA